MCRKQPIGNHEVRLFGSYKLLLDDLKEVAKPNLTLDENISAPFSYLSLVFVANLEWIPNESCFTSTDTTGIKSLDWACYTAHFAWRT